MAKYLRESKLREIQDSQNFPLTFQDLRYANIARLPLFKNAQGEIAHHAPDGSDWSEAEWLEAVLGELGEYANLKKKIRRGDFEDAPEAQLKRMLADELADTLIYLDLLAYRLGIDLAVALREKFNRVSRQQELDVFL